MSCVGGSDKNGSLRCCGHSLPLGSTACIAMQLGNIRPMGERSRDGGSAYNSQPLPAELHVLVRNLPARLPCSRDGFSPLASGTKLPLRHYFVTKATCPQVFETLKALHSPS